MSAPKTTDQEVSELRERLAHALEVLGTISVSEIYTGMSLAVMARDALEWDKKHHPKKHVHKP